VVQRSSEGVAEALPLLARLGALVARPVRLRLNTLRDGFAR
jgi:hypothetical protein